MTRLRSEAGFLTVDFLFAMTMAAVLVIMMFAFTTTLTILEIAQYIGYSTARAHMAGHKNQQRQEQLATQKFESFQDPTRYPALAPLLTNGWFEIDLKSLEIRGGGKNSVDGSFNEQYGYEENAMPQLGIRFRLQASLLKMNLPLMGQVTEDSDFGTYVTGLLIREPTVDECRSQLKKSARFDTMLNQDSRFKSLYGGAVVGVKQGTYFEMEDTGC